MGIDFDPDVPQDLQKTQVLSGLKSICEKKLKTASISRSARVSKAKEEHIKECERLEKIQQAEEAERIKNELMQREAEEAERIRNERKQREAEEAVRIKNERILREAEEAERIKNERIQREAEEAERIKNGLLQREAEIAKRAHRDKLMRETKEREKKRLEVLKKREEEKRKQREQQLESERKKQIILQQQRELELKKKIEAEAIRREAMRKEEEDTKKTLNESVNNLAKEYEESSYDHVQHQDELDFKIEKQFDIQEKHAARKHKLDKRRRSCVKYSTTNLIGAKENYKKDTETNLNHDTSKIKSTTKKRTGHSHENGEEYFDSNDNLAKIQDSVISREENNTRRHIRYGHGRARKRPSTIYSINDDSEDNIGDDFKQTPDKDKPENERTTRNHRNYGDTLRRKHYSTQENSGENLVNNPDQDTPTRKDKASQNKSHDYEQTRMCIDFEDGIDEIKDNQMKRKVDAPSPQQYHIREKRRGYSSSKEVSRKGVERDKKSVAHSERSSKIGESTKKFENREWENFEQDSHVNGKTGSNSSGSYPSKARKNSHQAGSSGRLKHSSDQIFGEDNRTRKRLLGSDRCKEDCADENTQSNKVENRKEPKIRKRRRNIYGKTHNSPRKESKPQSKDHDARSQTRSHLSSKNSGTLKRSNQKDVSICDIDPVKKPKLNGTSDNVISRVKTNRLSSRKTTESTKLPKKKNNGILSKSTNSVKVTSSRSEKTIDIFSSTLNDSNSTLPKKSKNKQENLRSDRRKLDKFRATKELPKSKTTSRRRKKVSTGSKGTKRSQGKTNVMDGTDYEFSFM